jgi:class 3 adenylate cyclase
VAVIRSGVIRKLAAILIADVVGFSRHMERDEGGAFERLRDIRARLVDPKIAEYGGRVVKTAGDGMLLEFGSADAALRCAIDLQRAMSAENLPLSSEERIEFRIGINLGDIIVDGSDIAGDGVNVAARLEALPEPGGICVSAAVREQVHGHRDHFSPPRRDHHRRRSAGTDRRLGHGGSTPIGRHHAFDLAHRIARHVQRRGVRATVGARHPLRFGRRTAQASERRLLR